MNEYGLEEDLLIEGEHLLQMIYYGAVEDEMVDLSMAMARAIDESGVTNLASIGTAALDLLSEVFKQIDPNKNTATWAIATALFFRVIAETTDKVDQ